MWQLKDSVSHNIHYYISFISWVGQIICEVAAATDFQFLGDHLHGFGANAYSYWGPQSEDYNVVHADTKNT